MKSDRLCTQDAEAQLGSKALLHEGRPGMSVFRWLSRGIVPAARYLNSCLNPCDKALGKNWNVNVIYHKC